MEDRLPKDRRLERGRHQIATDPVQELAILDDSAEVSRTRVCQSQLELHDQTLRALSPRPGRPHPRITQATLNAPSPASKPLSKLRSQTIEGEPQQKLGQPEQGATRFAGSPRHASSRIPELHRWDLAATAHD
jgi:hypothetical protein